MTSELHASYLMVLWYDTDISVKCRSGTDMTCHEDAVGCGVK